MMKELYPISDCFNEFWLPVGNGHSIFVQEYGNPKGLPIIAFHGGPGGYAKPEHASFFNPKKYRIILFDQRGCGKSTFTELLQENTAQALVADAEKIRKHLAIEKWHVTGRSWGSTLALLYSETFTESCLSLLVAGIYFGSERENTWLYGEQGAARMFPDTYAPFKNYFTQRGKNISLANLKEVMLNGDEDEALEAAVLMFYWETSVSKLISEEAAFEYPVTDEDRQGILKAGKIMLHYLSHDAFLQKGQLLNNAYKLKDLPGVIIHGRYDLICPFENAWNLSQAWPEADFEIIPDAGHHHSEAGTTEKLLEYAEKFSKIKAAV